MKQKKLSADRNRWCRLLFWPAWVLRYWLLERIVVRGSYIPVYCFLDDWIPFREEFLIPYVFWYGLLIGMHLYTFCRDTSCFERYTGYLVISFSLSTVIFLIFPTCQNLRPGMIPRDNLLTHVVQWLYAVDTNTNVCPSEHVIGAVGVWLAGKHSKFSRKLLLFAAFSVLCFSSAIATVFLKQHSVIDIFTAIPVCVIGWYFSFHRPLKSPCP